MYSDLAGGALKPAIFVLVGISKPKITLEATRTVSRLYSTLQSRFRSCPVFETSLRIGAQSLKIHIFDVIDIDGILIT